MSLGLLLWCIAKPAIIAKHKIHDSKSRGPLKAKGGILNYHSLGPCFNGIVMIDFMLCDFNPDFKLVSARDISSWKEKKYK